MEFKAYIFNWLDNGKNAKAWLQLFKESGIEAVVISSTMPGTHPEFREYDPRTYNFYGMHWHIAKMDFLRSNAKAIIHVQADCLPRDGHTLSTFLLGAKAMWRYWGVIAPDVNFTWHTYENKPVWSSFPRYKNVPCTDSTFWCIKREIVEWMPDTRRNTYGWHIDELACKRARATGLRVLRDTHNLILHPKSTQYNTETARKEGLEYFNSK